MEAQQAAVVTALTDQIRRILLGKGLGELQCWKTWGPDGYQTEGLGVTCAAAIAGTRLSRHEHGFSMER